MEMVKSNTKDVLINRMSTIVGNLAYRDYLSTNISSRGKLYKHHRPYSLSEETEKARDMLNLLYKDGLSKDDEEVIKGYIMQVRLYNPSLLDRHHGISY